MKKFGWFLIAFVALMVLLANVGPMMMLGISIWLLYIIFKQFMKTDSTVKKIGWIMVGLIVLSVAMSNVYAVIGLVAAYVLYVTYKKWKAPRQESGSKSDDPFVNFEKEWAELNKC